MMTRSVLLRPGMYGIALSLGLAAIGCSDDEETQPMPTQPGNIVETAQEAGLSTLLAAATTAGLADTLTSGGPFTVFAPTNAAFAALGSAVPTDPELLANVLLHHVVSGTQDSTAVTTMGPFTTLAGTSLAVDTNANPITVGSAALSATLDVEASNGIVHVMDEVIVPPTILQAAQATADLSTLVTAVSRSSMGVQMALTGGPLTVFAPTNAAFTASGIDLDNVDQADLDRILQYHVVASQNTSGELTDGQTITTVSGDTLTVNVSGASITLTDAEGQTINVVTRDLRLLNGVVHIIDTVLNPGEAGPGNIAQVASDAGFSTLLGAATRAGLADALASPDNTFTVFAPTDAAFTALGVDLMPVNDAVIGNILLQHILIGDIDSAQVTATASFTTAANLPLAIDTSGMPITVGDANLSSTLDVEASNGRIHVMDEVIVPPSILEVAQGDPNFSSLVSAVGAASSAVQDALAPDTLAGAMPITVFAPVNAAFTGIDLNALSQSQVDRILSHHAVMGQTLSTDLTDGQVIATLNGSITVNIDGANQVSLTDEMGTTVNVVATNLRTRTGVIHAIDGVLMPQPTIVDLAVDGGLVELVGAVTAAGLGETLTTGGPFTVFAPTDAAFAALGNISPTTDVLANILLHHVVPGTNDSAAVVAADSFATAANTSIDINAAGQPITVGGANLSSTLDLTARNGIVHLMDQVIVPPTIVEVAAATPTLSDLVAALTATNLVSAVSPDTLNGDQPITVFAPNNAAFTEAGIDINSPPANVADVLRYHVVAGQALSTDLTDGQTITTVLGETLEVNIDGGNVQLIDKAGETINVIGADIRTLTGVVHLIDGVLSPTN